MASWRGLAKSGKARMQGKNARRGILCDTSSMFFSEDAALVDYSKPQQRGCLKPLRVQTQLGEV
jgi:hypothetical protein